MSLKVKLYNFFVRSNEKVRNEYERYVIEHIEEHRSNRIRHIMLLIKLNWHYRIKKSKFPYIYNDEKQVKIGDLAQISAEKDVSFHSVYETRDNLLIKEIPSVKQETIIRRDAPVLTLVFSRHNEIKISFGEKLYYCNVYKKIGSGEYKFWKQLREQSDFVDYDVCAGKKYEYKVKASDNGENFSKHSNALMVVTPGRTKYDLIYGEEKLYHDGAESTYKKRMNVMNFAKMLMRYDVISFDIFDTLIFRPFSKPSDVFVIVGQELGIMDFCELRFAAEEKARQINQATFGNREVTIYDIYKQVSIETGIDIEKGVEIELSVEKNLCYPNPYMLEVFRLLKYQGKKIVALSDMYIPSDILTELLNKCGYTGFDDVIVSCEYSVSKRTGGLYDVLLDFVKRSMNKEASVIHVGDNEKSDIQVAKSKGIETYYYQNVNDKGMRFRATGMSHLVGSSYSGIVNAKLHNGKTNYSPYYEVGYVYAGIYILGFCNWIHKQILDKGITKILFLAREGDIYQRAFNIMFSEIDTQYFLWSRVPVVKTTVNFNRHPLLLQLVHHKANAIYKSRISTLFERCGFGELLKYCPKYGIKKDGYLVPENELIVKKLLTEHWDELCECYKEDQEEIRSYLESSIGGHKKIAVVDVGWSGNNVLQIKKLVEEVYKDDCEVFCMLAATREVNDTYMAGMIQNEEVESYIFSNVFNTHIHAFHQETNNRLNSFFFEILTQSCSPTFLGVHDGIFNFDIPEVENYERNREIHNGILDFVKEYSEHFKEYPYMCNISGNDAYMPFRKYVSDLSWVREYFSDYVFGRDLFATQDEPVMETVKEVMQKAKL